MKKLSSTLVGLGLILISLTTFAEETQESSAPKNPYALESYPSDAVCKNLIKTKHDKMTGKSEMSSKSLTIRTGNESVTSNMIIYDSAQEKIEDNKDARNLYWYVNGKDRCVGDRSSVLILFKDGTRMERSNSFSFSCQVNSVATSFRKIHPYLESNFDNYVLSDVDKAVIGPKPIEEKIVIEEGDPNGEWRLKAAKEKHSKDIEVYSEKVKQIISTRKELKKRRGKSYPEFGEKSEQEWKNLATKKIDSLRVNGYSRDDTVTLSDKQATQLMNTFACFHKLFYQ